MKTTLCVCGLLSLAVGCATTDDPRQGGLFSYNPKAYQQRLNERQRTMDVLQYYQHTEEEKSQQLENDIQQRQALLEQEREKLGTLDDELVRLQQNISRYQAQNDVQKTEKQRLDREVKRLKTQITVLKADRQRDQADKASQIELLKRDITTLSNATSQLQ